MEKRRQVLVKALKDSDETIRSYAAEALERLDLRSRISTFEKLVASGEKMDKLRAIYALSNLRGDKVVDILISATKDPVEDVRAAAIRVLGRIADHRVLPVLVECLKDENVIVKRVAVDAISNFRDSQLMAPVMHMLKSRDAGVVERAIEFIGRSGDRRAEEAMVYFAIKGNLSMRYRALKALGVMEP